MKPRPQTWRAEGVVAVDRNGEWAGRGRFRWKGREFGLFSTATIVGWVGWGNFPRHKTDRGAFCCEPKHHLTVQGCLEDSLGSC